MTQTYTPIQFPQIEGVQWERNTINHLGDNDLLWVGSLMTTLVYRRESSEGEYPLQGLHYRFDDRLTFVRKSDEMPIIVDMVDLRRGSPTARNTLRVVCRPDPTRRLVIPRGVAHLPQQLKGCLTLNSPVLYWDWRGFPTPVDVDIRNFQRVADPQKLPLVDVARFPYPKVLLPFMLERFHKLHQHYRLIPHVAVMEDGRQLVLRRV